MRLLDSSKSRNTSWISALSRLEEPWISRSRRCGNGQGCRSGSKLIEPSDSCCGCHLRFPGTCRHNFPKRPTPANTRHKRTFANRGARIGCWAQLRFDVTNRSPGSLGQAWFYSQQRMDSDSEELLFARPDHCYAFARAMEVRYHLLSAPMTPLQTAADVL